MTCGFSLEHYGEVCRLLLSRQYQPVYYHEVDTRLNLPRVVILRHDVDQSLEQAAKFAEIEHSCGLKSTFFVWLRSPFYNPFDAEQARLIQRIRDLGHDVGLHFDESAYAGAALSDLVQAVSREAGVLSTLLEMPVRAVSMHRPSQITLDQDLHLDGGLINAYQHRFFREFKYLSDSNRRWREGCVCSWLTAEPSPPPHLHLLTHAFWWTEEDTGSVDRRVFQFLCDKGCYIDRELARNISAYRRLFRQVTDE